MPAFSLEQITESTVSIAVQGAWPDQSIADYEGNAAVAVVGRVVCMGAECRTIQELDPVENSWERVGAAAASPFCRPQSLLSAAVLMSRNLTTAQRSRESGGGRPQRPPIKLNDQNAEQWLSPSKGANATYHV
jgi:hypothetical protein